MAGSDHPPSIPGKGKHSRDGRHTSVVVVVLFWVGHWQVYILFNIYCVHTTPLHGAEMHQSHIQYKLGQ